MGFTIAFLSTPTRPHNDNHVILPQWFTDAGWQVRIYEHDELNFTAGNIAIGNANTTDIDLIWPIGLGPKETFMDRVGLMALMTPGKLITTPHAYVLDHGKAAWLSYAPPTHVANNPIQLIDAFHNIAQPCVLKPMAGSFGREVRLITKPQDINEALERVPKQYWLLQPYLNEIVDGETRTLICGRHIIGSYLRRPKFSEPAEIQANLAMEGSAEPVALSSRQEGVVQRVQQTLLDRGVRFASIDTVGEYLMEVNIANPGGLSTMCRLYGATFERAARETLVRACQEHVLSWRPSS